MRAQIGFIDYAHKIVDAIEEGDLVHDVVPEAENIGPAWIVASQGLPGKDKRINPVADFLMVSLYTQLPDEDVFPHSESFAIGAGFYDQKSCFYFRPVEGQRINTLELRRQMSRFENMLTEQPPLPSWDTSSKPSLPFPEKIPDGIDPLLREAMARFPSRPGDTPPVPAYDQLSVLCAGNVTVGPFTEAQKILFLNLLERIRQFSTPGLKLKPRKLEAQEGTYLIYPRQHYQCLFRDEKKFQPLLFKESERGPSAAFLIRYTESDPVFG